MSYTLSVSGTTFTVKNPSGAILYSGIDSQVALSTLISNVPSGGIGYINAGTYPQISGHTISKNITLDGDKTAIIQRIGTTTNPMLLVTSDNITIKNIKLFANLIASTGISSKTNYLTIDGVEIKDTSQTIQWAHGISCNNSAAAPKKGLIVRNCYIHNIRFSGVCGLYTTDSLIEKNIFEDCAQLYPSGGSVAMQDGCNNVTIQDNVMQGRTDNDGAYLGQQTHWITGVKFLRNKMNLKLYHPGGTQANTAGCGLKLYGTGVIEDNEIDWNSSLYIVGISAWGANCTINNNIVKNSKYGIAGFSGLSGQGSHTITNNQLINDTTGIYLEQSGCKGGGNVFTNCGTNITGTLTPITPPPVVTTYTLTVSSPIGSGIVVPSLGVYTYNSGSSVPVSATPSSGWLFDHWIFNDGTSTVNPGLVLMDANHTLQAVFTQIPVNPCQQYIDEIAAQDLQIQNLNAQVQSLQSQNASLQTQIVQLNNDKIVMQDIINSQSVKISKAIADLS